MVSTKLSFPVNFLIFAIHFLSKLHNLYNSVPQIKFLSANFLDFSLAHQLTLIKNGIFFTEYIYSSLNWTSTENLIFFLHQADLIHFSTDSNPYLNVLSIHLSNSLKINHNRSCSIEKVTLFHGLMLTHLSIWKG